MTPLLGLPFVSEETVLNVGRALAVLFIGGAIARIVASLIGRIAGRGNNTQARLVFGRVAWYVLLVVVIVATLHQVGVDMGVLLGTAGILTIALGFASQTSASNLISGLFLLLEKPFVVGDIIRVGTTTGEVVRVDTLSVKLRTFDNLFIRIPNETLLKLEIINISHFPIRRLDLKLGVPYGVDIAPLREALFGIASDNPIVLDEPTPMVIVDGFLESSVAVQFSIWAARQNFLEMKNSVLEEIQREIYAGEFPAPYPVRVMVDRDAGMKAPVEVEAEATVSS